MKSGIKMNHEKLNEEDKLIRRKQSQLEQKKERWANDFLFGVNDNLTARYFGILEEVLND